MVRRRHLLAILAAPALMPFAAACRSDETGAGAATPGRSVKGTANMERDGLTLRASLSLRKDPAELVIEYRVENHGSGPAYVFDKLIVPGPDGQLQADRGRAYVYPDPKADTVTVMKDIAPVPQGMEPTSLVVPLMRRLEPGKVLERAIALPLPLRPWREYLTNTLGFPHETRVDHLRFRVGYALPPDGAEYVPLEYAGAKGDNFRNPPGKQQKAGALEMVFETPGLPVFLPE